MSASESRIDLHDASIALVGAGHLGQAMLAGWLGATSGIATQLSARNFQVVNPSQGKRELIQNMYGVSCVDHVSKLEPCDIVVMAVKPQVLPQVLAEMGGFAWMVDALVVSVAAGVTTATIQQPLPATTRVVRAMPNVPLRVSLGATGVCAGQNVADGDVETVRQLFASIGEAVTVREDQMDAVTAVSGSGPAYIAALVDAMAQAGVQAGLDEEAAQTLALATAEGTAVYMRSCGLSARETCDQICVAGGTTEAALKAMEAAGFTQAMHEGVQAAVARSKELGA